MQPFTKRKRYFYGFVHAIYNTLYAPHLLGLSWQKVNIGIIRFYHQKQNKASVASLNTLIFWQWYTKLQGLVCNLCACIFSADIDVVISFSQVLWQELYEQCVVFILSQGWFLVTIDHTWFFDYDFRTIFFVLFL